MVAGFSLLFLAGCQSKTELGQGGSMVSGSAGSAGAQGASTQLVRCDRPLGTAALVEPAPSVSSTLSSVGLQSPIPLLRLMMAQSGCFQVVDRGAALGNISTEQQLAQSGMLQAGSTTARGRMVTVQYLLTPNVIFSNNNSGGMSAGAALGGLLGPAGAIAGGLAGSMRFSEAQTALFLTDAQTGVQTGVAEGSAKATDFGGGAGLMGFGGGIAGLGGIGGYGNTAEGKLIAAAFLDAYNKLVQQIRATAPNLAPVTQSATPQRNQHELVSDIQRALKSRKYYDGAVDGIFGKHTSAAIADYQRDNGLAVDGQPTEDLLQHITN
jgi:curli biogenesis system outer membrane secretion channel CsgG